MAARPRPQHFHAVVPWKAIAGGRQLPGRLVPGTWSAEDHWWRWCPRPPGSTGNTLGHGHQLGKGVPGGFGSPVLGVHLGKLSLLHSPVWPGDAPAPRVLGADPSISGEACSCGHISQLWLL